MTVGAPVFQLVPIIDVVESSLNPRTRYDADAIAQLAESIRAKGILTPLLLREPATTGPFTIAAGHRRYRAATLAGLEQLPAVTRLMDDVTFLETLTFENDEREDLHPLEEAIGYSNLMKRAGYTIPRLAERRGLDASRVRERLRLLNLIKPARELFLDRRFELGHANILATLTPQQQERLITVPKAQNRYDLRGEREGLWIVDGGVLFEREDAKGLDALKPVSVKELQAYVNTHVRLNLTAPVVTELFPDTVATVTAAAEAEEKIVKITRQHFIQPDARDAKERTIGPMSWRRADGRPGAKACAHAVTGVIVVGPGRGQAFKVCLAKEQCTVHWAAYQRERAARRRTAGAGPRPAASGPSASSEQARKKAEADQERHKQIEERTAARVLEAILAKVTFPLSRLDTETVLWALIENGGYPDSDALESVLKGADKPHTLTPAALARTVVGIAVASAEAGWNTKAAAALELRYKVDRKAIAKQVEMAMTAAELKTAVKAATTKAATTRQAAKTATRKGKKKPGKRAA